jgi:archaemetzincin
MASFVPYKIYSPHIKELFYVVVFTLITGSFNSCRNNVESNAVQKEALTIELQPLGDIRYSNVIFVYNSLKKIYPNIVLNKLTAVPANAYYELRNHYRADTIIYDISIQAKKDHVIIALTNKDISTTKNGIADYGIMGFGYQPGNACAVSTFRLSKINTQEQLFKVAMHELGHTQGLPHCDVRTCFMRDAEGKNHTDEEKEFCTKCKKVLEEKGWKF